MKDSKERQIDIPGMVNRLPDFRFTVPIYLPKEMNKHMSAGDMEIFRARIRDLYMYQYFDRRENDVEVELVKPTWGAGDFLINVHVRKHPERKTATDYYEEVIESVRNLNYVLAQRSGFGITKKFTVQGHYLDVPQPLDFGSKAA